MRLLFVLYFVAGILVAANVIGNEGNYFSGLNTIEEFVEMILAILLWPLVLLDVNVNIGDIDIDIGGGDAGGDGSAGAADGSGGGSGGGSAGAGGGGGGR